MQALQFDNRFVAELPGDSEPQNFRRQVTGACFSRVNPTPGSAPRLVAVADEVAELLDLTPADCATQAFVDVFTGNTLMTGMDPHAMCYGGHQFGNWAGQLGDGRAIVLGESVNRQGERHVLQLKGAGPTPYSRTADGLAVLRSSVREFLCSEAMYHLGVPTTRALSLTLTGDEVMRDMLYDGHPAPEPGAVVCRVAPTFTRFGNFELLASRGEIELLRQLADFTIAHHFPALGSPGEQSTYVAWFNEIAERTATMITEWMRVGFVHGVMNTDNMSILGLTIDYGPYGWLEDYDPNWTPNTTDAATRRYRFGQQPNIAQWNLLQLANAIYPLIGEAKPLEEVLGNFADTYQRQWHEMMAGKLGLAHFEPADSELLTELGNILQLTETDMTLFFRGLADLPVHGECADRTTAIAAAYYDPQAIERTGDPTDNPEGSIRRQIEAWLERYVHRVRNDGISDGDRRQRMNTVNPLFVMRNYLAQLAIDRATQGDFSTIHDLLDTMRKPYETQPGREQFAEKRPDWARTKVGCSMLSCSS